ncbi:unnamed protein product [Adineta steineri]|uniref:Pheromone-processing carboxypeptidase KEX1 n=1 Tax=Adineta steineri TaxID=433720 RepID=A0A819TPX2_9BILA|nr:unnamed protein product [Adineta steineri]CAF4081164.1 unnamed protein product [Adineta steineri]
MHPLSSMVTKLLIFFSIIAPLTFALQATDFYVQDLPLLPKGASSIRMHAGLLPVNPQHNGSLFFWHFEKKYPSDKLRTVIWLDGGPGCSSMAAAWTEIGPFRFQDENTIIENDGSWHLYTNLLFVDQPVGTGFSTIDTDSFIHELDEMANQFLSFLDQYMKIFPELLENDIYLAGISFAGQFIPYIAKAILEQRSTLKLRGLLIGNGWIDPVTMYKSYLPFAVANNLVVANSDLYNRINIEVKRCEHALFKQATEAMIDGMTWNGGTGFDFGNGTSSPKDPWIVDGESAGLIRSAHYNFIIIQITQSLFLNHQNVAGEDVYVSEQETFTPPSPKMKKSRMKVY